MTIDFSNPDNVWHFETGACYVKRDGTWVEVSREECEAMREASGPAVVVTSVDRDQGTVTYTAPWAKIPAVGLQGTRFRQTTVDDPDAYWATPEQVAAAEADANIHRAYMSLVRLVNDTHMDVRPAIRQRLRELM